MVGTLEEAVGKKEAKARENLSEYDKEKIGGPGVLKIPFDSVYNMRRIADLLHQWADTANVWSRRTDIPDHEILFHLKWELGQVRYKIQELSGVPYKNRPRLR